MSHVRADLPFSAFQSGVWGRARPSCATADAGPKAAAQAEEVRTRLLPDVDDKRKARTNATVDQLLDRYLDVLKIEDTTRTGYERLIRNHRARRRAVGHCADRPEGATTIRADRGLTILRQDARMSTGPSQPVQRGCFYICPIGTSDSIVRKRSNQIYKHIVCSTLQPLGYNMIRADEMEQSGTITSQIIQGLLNEDLVVADLTDHNPNVFYELAIRHAVRKPFIQLIADRQKLPFDIQNLRTIFVDHTDLDSVDEAKRTIAGMVESIQSGASVETPLTYTLDLQSLRQSEDSEARGIAEIISEVSSLKKMLQHSGALRVRPPSPELATFRRFVYELADAGRLMPSDLDTLLAGVTSAAHSQWLLNKIKPIVDQRAAEEPPF